MHLRYYFKDVKLDIPKEENYQIIIRIIEEYNRIAPADNKIVVSALDDDNLRNKKNSDLSFVNIVDKVVMKEAIKNVQHTINPIYKGITNKLFNKAIREIPIVDDDLLFGESASENHPDLMTWANFYLTKKEKNEIINEKN